MCVQALALALASALGGCALYFRTASNNAPPMLGRSGGSPGGAGMTPW
jgi:hypothetical protein